jgi:ferrous iron transport protein A
MVMRLSELKKGQTAIIEKIEDGPHAVQLMEMGFVAGKPVTVNHIAPLGDPMAVSIAGYVLSIRKFDAQEIWVRLQ